MQMKTIVLSTMVASVSAFGGTDSTASLPSFRAAPMMMGTAGSSESTAYGGGGFGGGGGAYCPSGSSWGGQGYYCLSGDLYSCYSAGSQATFTQACQYGCTPAPKGYPDQCDSRPPSPTPWPTYSPPTPYPTRYSCQRPTWYGGDACADFGAFKGKDLAWQACANNQMSSYGGGGGMTCEDWQQAACEDSYRRHVANCCPNTSENYMYLCNPYNG